MMNIDLVNTSSPVVAVIDETVVVVDLTQFASRARFTRAVVRVLQVMAGCLIDTWVAGTVVHLVKEKR